MFILFFFYLFFFALYFVSDHWYCTDRFPVILAIIISKQTYVKHFCTILYTIENGIREFVKETTT